MLALLIQLFLLNLTSFFTQNVNNNDSESGELYLKMIDISKDTVLSSILKDVASEEVSTKSAKKRFFSVFLTEVSPATEVCVERIETDVIYMGEYKVVGYCELDNSVFFFSNDSDYKLNYASPTKQLKIKTTDKELGYIDEEEWIYYIFSNCYARWLYRFDLLWYPPKGRKITSDQFLLTAPKRTSK